MDEKTKLNSLADSVVEAKAEVIEMKGTEISLSVKIEGTDFVVKVSSKNK